MNRKNMFRIVVGFLAFLMLATAVMPLLTMFAA